jgi:hypothetical protein
MKEILFQLQSSSHLRREISPGRTVAGRKKVETILLAPFLVLYFYSASGNIRYGNTLFIRKKKTPACFNFTVLPSSAAPSKAIFLIASWPIVDCHFAENPLSSRESDDILYIY